MAITGTSRQGLSLWLGESALSGTPRSPVDPRYLSAFSISRFKCTEYGASGNPWGRPLSVTRRWGEGGATHELRADAAASRSCWSRCSKARLSLRITSPCCSLYSRTSGALFRNDFFSSISMKTKRALECLIAKISECPFRRMFRRSDGCLITAACVDRAANRLPQVFRIPARLHLRIAEMAV